METSAIFVIMCILFSSVASLHQDRKRYIVYMGSLPEGEYSPSSHHAEIIKEVVHYSFASKALVTSYTRSFNGFSAYLSEEEQQQITRIAGVVSVFPCQKLQLQTTRSWNFLGLTQTVERRPAMESDTIVGVIDGGVWPESESFSDIGYGPIPSKWKGECDGGNNFVCNRKIIGARWFGTESGDLSARDINGHGTHVSSTIAGNPVHASYYGIADGLARGGVPSARLAVYKACDPTCVGTYVLSAFDHAIADGVDIISVSLGSDNPLELTDDPIAIGAFHAIERGILTVNSAGNRGPRVSSIVSYAPWILTVAASDTDRKIVNELLLENGATLMGHTISAFPSSDEPLPIVYGKEVTTKCSEANARNCVIQCLERSLVTQKVIVCDQRPDLQKVINSGATGCIFPASINVSDVVPLPAIALSENDLNLVKEFKNSSRKPRVKFFKSEAVNNPDAPSVAEFSSRGPSIFIYDLIKPDVTAPGVEILAAWYGNSTEFNIISGTSMACPHVSAAAAFVKSFHPDWSPSAIKSALMTTARDLNDSLHPEGQFAFGSGHIDPVKATDPGLVYETPFEEYLQIWCNLSRSIGRHEIPKNISCPTKLTHREINYPSMAARVEVGKAFEVSFPRTVTNVGLENSIYVAHLEGDTSLNVTVEPNSLHFTSLNQKIKFVQTVRGNITSPFTRKSVSLVWTDGIHKVRSPTMIYITPQSETTPSRPTPPTPTPSSKGSTPPRLHNIFLLILLLMMNSFVLRQLQ